eukprot:SM000107S14064  [mRNA]  locus=s107:195411:197237:- [translate_table: standard]
MADFEALTEATAGAAGSLLSTTLLYPLDTCKTKFQAEAQHGAARKYRSMLDVLREAVAAGRLSSLYQGLATKNAQAVAAGFVYFYAYSFIRRQYLLRSGRRTMGTGANLLVAAAAGCCTTIATQPLDTASARMQTSEPGQAQGLLTTVKERSLRQAYDGLGASLFLCCNPAIQALQYTVFEQLKNRILRRVRLRREARAATLVDGPSAALLSEPILLTAFSAFVLGALSKTVATIITYPAIRCKVLLQRESTSEEKLRRANGELRVGPPATMIQALQIIWQREGILGFYKGLQAQILKTVLSAALMLMIKEKVTAATALAMWRLREFLLRTRANNLLKMQ